MKYVFVNGFFVSYKLVAQEYTFVESYHPNITCCDTFLKADQTAYTAQISLWAPVEILIPTVSKVKNTGCDLAYPTLCIPSSPQV
ncbi:MAG: thermonuclease family protein [Chloroflexi bacterium]|nr:thermonuclease family protein [Chloroflexota bacterium]